MSKTNKNTSYLFLPHHRMGISAKLPNKLNENEYGKDKRAAFDATINLIAEKKDIPEHIKEGITAHFVSNFEEVIKLCFK